MRTPLPQRIFAGYLTANSEYPQTDLGLGSIVGKPVFDMCLRADDPVQTWNEIMNASLTERQIDEAIRPMVAWHSRYNIDCTSTRKRLVQIGRGAVYRVGATVTEYANAVLPSELSSDPTQEECGQVLFARTDPTKLFRPETRALYGMWVTAEDVLLSQPALGYAKEYKQSLSEKGRDRAADHRQLTSRVIPLVEAALNDAVPSIAAETGFEIPEEVIPLFMMESMNIAKTAPVQQASTLNNCQ